MSSALEISAKDDTTYACKNSHAFVLNILNKLDLIYHYFFDIHLNLEIPMICMFSEYFVFRVHKCTVIFFVGTTFGTPGGT